MNKAKDVKEGYEIAKEMLLKNKALTKFKGWLSISNE